MRGVCPLLLTYLLRHTCQVLSNKCPARQLACSIQLKEDYQLDPKRTRNYFYTRFFPENQNVNLYWTLLGCRWHLGCESKPQKQNGKKKSSYFIALLATFFCTLQDYWSLS